MDKVVKNACILTIITLISGLLLGSVYEITKEPIRMSREHAKQKAYQAVMKDAEEFEEYEQFDEKEAEDALETAGVSGCYVKEAVVAKDENGAYMGYVVTTVSKEGYGGEIEVSVGILKNGTVTGVEILTITETAGLGMKALEPAFKNQFKDVQTEKFEVKKDNPEGNVDAISGATITTRAITNAVNAGLGYFQKVLGGSVNE